MESSNELVSFYNVENLFSPMERARINPKDQLNRPKKWGEWRYKNKLEKIAHVFQLIEKDRGVLPMLIGLAEINSDKVLEDLIQMQPFGDRYGFVHYDSLDERGVDTALLYDKSKIKLVDSEAISFVFEIGNNQENVDTTRDVLHSQVEYEGEKIHVFVLHLPSKREQDINQSKRDYILKNINEKIADIVQRKEAVIVCGDFNENPTAENMNFLLFNNGIDKILENPYVELYKNRMFSTFHHKQGLLFDQIILSQDFYTTSSVLEFKEAVVFSHESIKSKDKRFAGRPFRTYAGTRYLGGYSDHYPVFVEFKKRKTN
ncbi:MAG: endonuclease [Cloacibacterium sp.]|nr:endonuclease [Cloacibacterium sp.]